MIRNKLFSISFIMYLIIPSEMIHSSSIVSSQVSTVAKQMAVNIVPALMSAQRNFNPTKPLHAFWSEKAWTDQDWKASEKYEINPNKYCGLFPAELETQIAMRNNINRFKEIGVDLDSNFIFHGPPGTGKTLAASIFAQKINATFMYTEGRHFVGEMYTSTSKFTKEIFEAARKRRDLHKKPILVFIDEIETIIPARKSSKEHFEKRITGALLTEIGNPINTDILVVGATNRITDLDEALIRSGRLEHHIEFGLPDAKKRQELFKFFFKGQENLLDENINWVLISLKTNNFSQADFKKLCNTIKKNHVLQQIKNNESTIVRKIIQSDIEKVITQMQTRKLDKSNNEF